MADEVADLPRVLHGLAGTAVGAAAGGGPVAPDPDDGIGRVLPGAPGRVIGVWGPTGAPGRSTVALGIASETANLGVPTLLVDADTYGGSVAPMLAILDEVSGLLAACRDADSGRLRPATLLRHVRQVQPTLAVLTGLPRADRWRGVRQPSFAALVQVARESYPLVVLDLGFCIETAETAQFDTAAPRCNGVTLCGLEAADEVVVVGTADPLGITRLARAVLDLPETVPDARRRVVVNRLRRSLEWSEDEVLATVRRFTGAQEVRALPLDQSATDAAWVSGNTLPECAAESPLRRELSALAKVLTVADFPARRKVRRLSRR